MPVRGRAGTSPVVRDALMAELRRLRRLEAPVEQIVGVTDVLATIEAEYDRLNELRLDAVLLLRDDGLSYDAIAAETGLSRSRAPRREPASACACCSPTRSRSSRQPTRYT